MRADAQKGGQATRLVTVNETWIRIIDVAGIGIIFLGVGLGLAGFASVPFSRNARADMFQTIARLRCTVAAYILFGLEDKKH